MNIFIDHGLSSDMWKIIETIAITAGLFCPALWVFAQGHQRLASHITINDVRESQARFLSYDLSHNLSLDHPADNESNSNI